MLVSTPKIFEEHDPSNPYETSCLSFGNGTISGIRGWVDKIDSSTIDS